MSPESKLTPEQIAEIDAEWEAAIGLKEDKRSAEVADLLASSGISRSAIEDRAVEDPENEMSSEQKAEKRNREIDEVIERSRKTREEVENGSGRREFFEPVGNGNISEVKDQISGNGNGRREVGRGVAEPHWTDDLRSQSARADTFAFQSSGASLTGTAERIVDNYLPEMGGILAKYEPTAIAYGFPPAVDALITKTKLDPHRTALVLNGFRDAYALAGKWKEKAFAIVVRDENDTLAIREATELHRIVRDERINVEKKRKAIGEPALRETQLINGVANVYKDLLGPIETHLLAQSKFAENLERKRKEKVAEERKIKLALFEFDANSMQGLADMTDDSFEIFYTGVRERYHAKKRADEQEERIRRERERLAEIENQRLREENERLERERQEEAARTAEQRKLTELAEAARRAAQDKLDQQEAERKTEAARLHAEEERKRLAPDKEKLGDLAERIYALAAGMPPVDERFQTLTDRVKRGLETIATTIQGEIKDL